MSDDKGGAAKRCEAIIEAGKETAANIARIAKQQEEIMKIWRAANDN